MAKFKIEREPTLLPAAGEKVGRCAICGKPVYGNERVIVMDVGGVMFHENCAVFDQRSMSEFLDLFGLDYYTGTAKEMTEDV